jgi:8-oxo-dGTP pyrophosphatase MutT (NUDIX family)
VKNGTPEILYIKRASRSSDRWSSHIAFPGGRQEADDENNLYTAMRETWEEVGIDLAEKKDYLEIGQLDDREITTSLGKRLLMVLSPFGKSDNDRPVPTLTFIIVFLHISPEMPIPDIQQSEVASAHWVPLSCREFTR